MKCCISMHKSMHSDVDTDALCAISLPRRAGSPSVFLSQRHSELRSLAGNPLNPAPS